MTCMSISAVTLESETARQAYEERGVDLFGEVAECKYSIVVVLSERLIDPRFN